MPVQCSPEQYWQDLVWAINSPNLIRDDWFQQAQCNSPLRLNESAYSEAIARKLTEAVQATASNRLGHYFETLWIFFLSEFTDWQVVSSNQQVYDPIAKNTVGAFDLLVKTPEGKIEHWELAVKFYLGVKDQRQNVNWVGPNQVDNFQRKLSHLDQHQLKLAQHAASQDWLSAQSLTIHTSRAIAKGVLFYRQDPTPPQAAHAQHQQGRWLSASEWRQLNGKEFYRRPRAHWLGQRQADELEQRDGYDFSQPVLFSQFENGEEIQRYFVVADDWEQTL